MKLRDGAVKKIGRGYQVTLPKNFRDKFNLAEGDYVEAHMRGDSVVYKPAESSKAKALRGLRETLDSAPHLNLSKLPEKEIMRLVDDEIRQARQKRKKENTEKRSTESSKLP